MVMVSAPGAFAGSPATSKPAPPAACATAKPAPLSPRSVPSAGKPASSRPDLSPGKTGGCAICVVTIRPGSGTGGPESGTAQGGMAQGGTAQAAKSQPAAAAGEPANCELAELAG
jgi:hypothetical protein